MKPEVLEHLHHNKDFAEFCHAVMGVREHWISQLYDADPAMVQKISGRITACDEILVMARYSDLAEKWRRVGAS